MKIKITNNCSSCNHKFELTTSLNDIEILGNNYKFKELSLGKKLPFNCTSCDNKQYFLVNDIGCSIQVIPNGAHVPVPFTVITNQGYECNIDYTTSTRSYQALIVSLRDIEDLLSSNAGHDRPEKTILRLVFVHVITVMEAYLSEIINDTTINYHSKYKINLLKNDKNTKDLKITLHDLALNPSILSQAIGEYLNSIVYHNLSRVGHIFKAVFDVELPYIDGEKELLLRAVKTRHDCVHRNGQSLLENGAEIHTKDVHNLINVILRFTSDIEVILSTREKDPDSDKIWRNYNLIEDDTPF